MMGRPTQGHVQHTGEDNSNLAGWISVLVFFGYLSKRYVCPWVSCSIIYNYRDDRNNSSVIDRWKGKEGVIHTTQYYSAIKKNEIMPCAATRMDLEAITQSEVSQRNTNTI